MDMKIIVNGAELELGVATLAAALEALEYNDAVVATALNGHFVPARARGTTKLAEGDRIEIVAPRQGG
jgi:sulfur carrier protein